MMDPRTTSTVGEREASPDLEALRLALRALLVVSLLGIAITALVPVMIGAMFLPALGAGFAYAGLMAVTWAERRRYHARHAPTAARAEVGLRVAVGAESDLARDSDDAPPLESSAPDAPSSEAPSPEAAGEPLLTDDQRVGGAALLKIGAALALTSLIVALALFDGSALGVGLVLVPAYMALVGAAVWLASASDAVEDRHRPS